MELSHGESNSRYQGFIRKHPEAAVLTILVALYLFLANYYAWSSTFESFFFTTSGGSDPYFNWITIQHFFQTGHWLMFEPSLNYPIGTTNPRNPFFQVLTVFIAMLMSPFMSVNNAAFFTFEELDAFFGALLIIPVYLLGKEVFGKHGGLAASILYLLMPSNVSTGYLSDGRIHTPELFFVLFAIFFFERAIVTIDKGKIIDKVFPPTRIASSIHNFYKRNRLSTIYAMLAGTSLAALMLSWQGYAYAVVILLIYVLAQYVLNLFLKRPSDYLVYITSITILLGFLLGAYYYIGIGNYSLWFTPILLLGILVILMGFVFMAIRSKPWVISVPVIAILGVVLLAALATFDRSSFNTLLSGDGYFIKTRVYQTIAEASSLPFGEYVSSFGAFEFVIGISGISYAVYLYFKEKKDSMFFFLVFSLVSIYMSFEAARFNITAAPSYAILGGGFLIYFAHLVKLYDMKKKSGAPSTSIRKAIKGNISWVHTIYVLIIVALVISSGLAVISSAIPANTAAKYNQEIYDVVPLPLQPVNFSANNLYYVGATGNLIVNSTQPLSQSYAWLATQDANLPIQDKPAFVSWWDYGFQELQQGLHPTVADDFQQGYQVAGQILLAQNQSQILGLFIARTIEAQFNTAMNSFNQPVNNVLVDYFGFNESQFLAKIYESPSTYTSLILKNPSIYGQFISSIDSVNAYFALIKGQLASKYSLNTLVDAYSALEQVTGNSIQYIQIPSTLFPSSINATGTFYAPAYLTDSPSYVSSGGAIVPTNFYNIEVQTSNGTTYLLNDTPTNANITSENILYTSAFYQTSIYRFQVGIPASAVGLSSGIPGLTNSTANITVMPAWDMSNFEIVYELTPWNPYTDYTAHQSAWQDIPLQQAYYYYVNKIGTTVLFPLTSQMVTSANPIVAYYPGAIITGRVTLPNGVPVGGINVTIYDQYGIPHEVVSTDANGYYNITALPGNDSLVFSTGTLNSAYLYGSNILSDQNIYVSNKQAERQTLGYNTTTGLPNYYIKYNYQVSSSDISGNAQFEYQLQPIVNSSEPGQLSLKSIKTGTVFLTNATFGANISIPVFNGAYSMNNIPPYDYEVSLLTNGKYYQNIVYANISVGSSSVVGAIVKFDSIFVNVSSTYSGTAQGYQVTASDGSNTFYNVTNSTGGASLWVTPGTYTVYAAKDSSQTSISTVAFSDWNQNVSGNLTATLSAVVSGNLYNAEIGSKLYMYPNGQLSGGYNTTIGAGGKFSIEVPYGVYTLYTSSLGYSFVDTFAVRSNVTITNSLSLSYNLTVYSAMPGTSVYTGDYEFMGNSAYLEYTFSSPAPYTISLPEGFYGISVLTSYLGNVKEGFQNIYLVGNRVVSPTLSYTNLHTVSAYDSVSQNIKIESGLSILYSSGYPVYFGVITGGSSNLYNTNSSSTALSMDAISALYHSNTTTISGPEQSMEMTPISVNVTLVFTSTASQMVGSTNVTLTGYNSYHLSGKETGISASVQPGIYSVKAGNSTSFLNLSLPILVIPNTPSQSISIYATPYADLSVNSSSYLVFNSSGYEINVNSSIPFGSYLIYAYSNATGTPRASWNSYYVGSDAKVSPVLENANAISFKNSLGISGGNYTTTVNGMKINASLDSVFLPSGTFKVNYYSAFTNGTGSFVVSGTGTFSTSSGNQFIVPVTSTEIYATLTGIVTYNGAPVPNTVVTIMTSSGVTLDMTTTNSYGVFTHLVPTGTLELYALNNASGAGYLGQITIPAFSGTYSDNLSLVPAYLTYISVSLNSQVIYTNVSIAEGTSSLTVNTTSGSIVLPYGSYSFSASSSGTVRAFNGTILTVAYSTTTTVSVNSKQSVTLSLSQIITGSVVITQSKPYPSLATSNNLTNSTAVIFNVTNNQNAYSYITLSSGSNEWHILFNESYIGLAPGQTKSVNATVYALNNPEAGIESVPVNMSYSGNTISGYFNVDVVPRESFSASLTSAFGTPQATNIIYYVTLSNTGNAAITLEGSITNSADISDLYNSNSLLQYNGKTMNTITLQYGQSVNVSVLLSAIRSGSVVVPGTPVKLSFNATINGTNVSVPVSFTVEYPYASIIPYPTGNVIANYSGNALSTLVTGLLVIAVTVVGGIAISVYRGRRFRR